MVQTYNDSQYRFTDPIRYFKSNDPIYYEVDNIPLKQLHENTLWLKDQIGRSGTSNLTEIDRSGFSELKPYCTGNDNIIRVKPGRYSARINDAYNLTPLQIITNILESNGELSSDLQQNYNTWNAQSLNNTTLKSILNNFKSQVGSQALHLNGLAERIFTRPARNPNLISPSLGSTAISINLNSNGTQVPYPISQAQLWDAWTLDGDTKFVIKQYESGDAAIGFATLGVAEGAFTKRWRGVARTSIVDIPNELSIEIPKFESSDFFYVNEFGSTTQIDSNQRIDLLFIYSKPVDTSSTTVAKFVNGQPEQITQPKLGIVYGAGLGLNFVSGTTPKSSVVSALTPNGYVKILAHAKDQTSDNTGFIVSGNMIKGSFPSPDDLMNLTPMLSEDLSNNNFALIGQSILPIAYIVVKKLAPLNEVDTNRILNEDIIDIRPFFRTAELSYNERAGIAAAVPSISLANPVVGQAELDYEITRTYNSLLGEINNLKNQLGTRAQPLAAGYIRGGYKYGVEGTICDYLSRKYSLNNDDQLKKSKFLQVYGLDSTIQLHDLPDWDVAPWVVANSRGEFPNDYINVFQLGGASYVGVRNSYDTEQADFGCFSNRAADKKLGRVGTNAHWTRPGGDTSFMFVKKKILIDRETFPQGITDYTVRANYWNCSPVTETLDSEFTPTVGTAGIWVEKHPDYFIVYCAWNTKDWYMNLANKGLGGFEHPQDSLTYYKKDDNTTPTGPEITSNGLLNMPSYRNQGHLFAGHYVLNDDIAFEFSKSRQAFSGESNCGVAIYPTVQFEIIGHTSNTFKYDLNTNNVLLTFS